MTILQGFILVMGLGGQLMIARHDARGYLAWIAGNLALIVIYRDTQQLALMALPAMNTLIQCAALVSWARHERASVKCQHCERR